MVEWLSLVQAIRDNGITRNDRTGVGTKGIIGAMREYDLMDEDRMVLPVVTSKKTMIGSIVKELLWFIRGDTNINTLGCGIWDGWADERGDLGPIYGKQWRFWTDTKICPAVSERREQLAARGYHVVGMLDGEQTPRVVMQKDIDQLQMAIDTLRTNPDSRRIIVSAWNPGDIDDMALPPCHSFFQFFSETIDGERYLTCLLYQRSADVFLGVPFNIASYALLTHMVAQITSHKPRTLIHVTGDTHLYQNHLDLAERVLERPTYALPTLLLHPREEIDQYKLEDIQLEGYCSGEYMKAPVAL